MTGSNKHPSTKSRSQHDAREAWTTRSRARLVLQILRHELTVEQAAAQIHLPVETVRRWRKAFLQGAEKALSGEDPRAPRAQWSSEDQRTVDEIAASLSGDFHLMDPEMGDTGPRMEDRFRGAHAYWLLTTGRSGSTSLTRLLDLVPGIRASHEPFPALFHECRLALDDRPLSVEASRRLLWTTRGPLLQAARASKCVYFDCTPLMVPLAASCRVAFAWSRFVHLVRRPESFVCSALASGWYDDRNIRLGDMLPRPKEAGWARWQRLIWLWNLVHTKALSLETLWGPFLVHRLYAEDLFTGPKAFEDLLTWMAVDPDSVAQLRGGIYEATARSRNPSPDKPRWDPAWDSFLQEHAGPVMQMLYAGAPSQEPSDDQCVSNTRQRPGTPV